MKVILRSNVESLGQVGDVVDVAGGYARNYLLPKGLAIAASDGAIKMVEAEKAAYRRRVEKEIGEFKALADKMKSFTYTIACKAGEEDKLFGSVTTADIAEKINQEGFDVDKRKIKLSNPIHALGTYDVEIKLHPEVTAVVVVQVVKE